MEMTNPLFLNRCIGTKGSFIGTKASYSAKATRSKKPMTIGAMTAADFQGCKTPPHERPIKKRINPPTKRKEPM
jgi:hypothetical protein